VAQAGLNRLDVNTCRYQGIGVKMPEIMEPAYYPSIFDSLFQFLLRRSGSSYPLIGDVKSVPFSVYELPSRKRSSACPDKCCLIAFIVDRRR
jgi:hypothetical protein